MLWFVCVRVWSEHNGQTDNAGGTDISLAVDFVELVTNGNGSSGSNGDVPRLFSFVPKFAAI